MHTFPLLVTLRPSLSAKTLAAAFRCLLGWSWTFGHWTHLTAVHPQRWSSAFAMTLPSPVLRDSPSALTRLRLSLCESALAKLWLSPRDDPFAHVCLSAPLPFWTTGFHLDLAATPPLSRGCHQRSTLASSHCATHMEETLTLSFSLGESLSACLKCLHFHCCARERLTETLGAPTPVCVPPRLKDCFSVAEPRPTCQNLRPKFEDAIKLPTACASHSSALVSMELGIS
jgi:hypothetical protein